MYEVTLILFRLYQALLHKRRFVRGRNNIPISGPLIVVANHESELDPWLIADLFPLRRKVRWWAKSNLFSVKERYVEYREEKKPFLLSWFLAVCTVCIVKNSNTVPVDRDNVNSRLNKLAIRTSFDILREDGVVGIFGEGGIDREGAKAIFVRLSIKSGVPILPIRISKEGIDIGFVIDAEMLRLHTTEGFHGSQELAEIIMRIIKGLNKENSLIDEVC